MRINQAVFAMRFFTAILIILLPTFSLAKADYINRRDAYLLIWDSIARPAFETAKEYTDVPEGDKGHDVISYGKRRGITIDDEYFRPDEQVLLADALLWIYRTRNVRELPDMQLDDLPGMIADYPIIEMNRELDARVTRDQLISMMMKLDGMLRSEVHEVSFYADDFHGRGTAFGETFDMHEITAAHRSLPHNTLVKVTNIENQESVVVRINDRGPYIEGRNMDMSLAAFGEIAHHGEGLIHATFERLGDADLVDECEQKQRLFQKRITKDVHLFRGVPHTAHLGEQIILQSNRPFVILGISFPDGQYLRIQDFILPEEKYRFSSDSSGKHTIHIGDTLGREREFSLDVSPCTL